MRKPNTGKAFASYCDNDNRDDFWTCPGCYSDLGNVREGQHECDDCGRSFICTVITKQACRTELVEAE